MLINNKTLHLYFNLIEELLKMKRRNVRYSFKLAVVHVHNVIVDLTNMKNYLRCRNNVALRNKQHKVMLK